MSRQPGVVTAAAREAVLVEPREGHGLRRVLPGRTVAGDPGGEAPAFHAGRNRQIQEIEDRRRHVHLLGLPLHDPAAPHPGDPHDQGDVQHLLVQRPAVLPAAVLEELLAVIGDEDDHGVLQKPAPAEEVEQLAEGRVVGGDLGVIEVQEVPEHLRRGRDLSLFDPVQEVHPDEALVPHAGGEALPERERGSIGGVRLHGVEIEEEGSVPLPLGPQPAGGLGVDVGRRAVFPRQELVGLEPLAQAEAARHIAVGDEPGGLVPPLPQALRQGDGLPGEDVPPAVDAMGAGQQAGEDGGGGGAGPGGLGHGVPEEDRAAGEGVDAGRDRPGIAIAAEVVRPQGVDEIDDDVARPASRLEGGRSRFRRHGRGGRGGRRPGGPALRARRGDGRPPQHEAAPRRLARLPGHGGEGDPRRPGPGVPQLHRDRSLVRTETGQLALRAAFGLQGHPQLSSRTAAGAEIVHRQHRSGGQAQEGVEPPAEGEGEPVAGRAHPGLLVDTGLEAERVPGHREVAAVATLPIVLLRRGVRPGIAQGEVVLPFSQTPPRQDRPDLSFMVRREDDPVHRLAVEQEGDLLLRSSGVRVRRPAECQRNVPRGGEEELQLRLRPVAPDEGVPAVILVLGPPLPQQRPGFGGPEVDPPGLALDLRQIEIGDQVANRPAGPRRRGPAAPGQEAEQASQWNAAPEPGTRHHASPEDRGRDPACKLLLDSENPARYDFLSAAESMGDSAVPKPKITKGTPVRQRVPFCLFGPRTERKRDNDNAQHRKSEVVQ